MKNVFFFHFVFDAKFTKFEIDHRIHQCLQVNASEKTKGRPQRQKIDFRVLHCDFKPVVCNMAKSEGVVTVKEAVRIALMNSESRIGMSLAAVRIYITREYPDVASKAIFKSILRKCISKGLETGEFKRAKRSEQSVGMQGYFKLASAEKNKVTKVKQSRGRSTSPKKTKSSKAAAKNVKPKASSQSRSRSRKSRSASPAARKTGKKPKSTSASPAARKTARKVKAASVSPAARKTVKKTKSKSASPAARKPVKKAKSASKSPSRSKSPKSKAPAKAAKAKNVAKKPQKATTTRKAKA
ncbi:hypothetical protein ACOMHN_045069 [Nucella lapillus]